ncbi:MAG TPA: DUF4340 domain-containing protein [Polyangia bacterium]|jgi:hypothetical protein
MTGKSLALQGGLAIAGLVIAYGTWQREPERAAGEAVIVDSTKAELGSVHYEDDNGSVDIQRRDEGGESSPWLHVVDKTPVPPPLKPGQPAPPPAKPRPPRDLRGEEPAEKFLAQFAPFRSPRAFGVLDAAKAKELGLDASKKKLVVTARGEKHEFVVGQPAQSSTESYLRDVKDGRTYLMPRSLLTDLQGAGHRLVDRRLHTFKIADFNRLTITAAGKDRAFIVSNGHDQNAYKLAPAATPDKPDEQARNWHEKIWKLFPSELLGKGEAPAAGEPRSLVRVDYYDGAKRLGWLEIGKVELPGSAPASISAVPPPAATNNVETYGRTEHTAGWVKLNNDPTLLQDAEKIAAGS